MNASSAVNRGLLILVVGVALTTGCGRTGPKSVTVTGDVTYRGKPVNEATVLFMSTKTRPADGTTDAQGRFEMKTFVSEDGAKADEQVVCVTKTVPDPRVAKDSPYAKRMSILPGRYATPVQSPLKASVTLAGPNEFHFELTD
jgi:hypothetical protein